MTRQYQPGRRIRDLETLQAELAGWSSGVNAYQHGVAWQMTVAGVGCELKSVHPKILL